MVLSTITQNWGALPVLSRRAKGLVDVVGAIDPILNRRWFGGVE